MNNSEHFPLCLVSLLCVCVCTLNEMVHFLQVRGGENLNLVETMCEIIPICLDLWEASTR